MNTDKYLLKENNTKLQMLLNKLNVGQLVKANVIKKINESHYLLDIQGVQLQAVSQIDLLSKKVWAKVTQLHPMFMIQVIVAEDKSDLYQYYQYLSDNNLNFFTLPDNYKEFFTQNYSFQSKDLYAFAQWYNNKANWSLIIDKNFTQLLNSLKNNNGKNIFSLLNHFYSLNIIFKNKAENLNTLIISKPEHFLKLSNDKKLTYSIKTFIQNDDFQNLIKFINAINHINLFKLGFLFIQKSNHTILLPVEIINKNNINILTTILQTKHFNNVIVKIEDYNSMDTNKIYLYFENNTVLNYFKDSLRKDNEMNKNQSLDIILSLSKDRTLYKWSISPSSTIVSYNYIDSTNFVDILTQILLQIITKDFELE